MQLKPSQTSGISACALILLLGSSAFAQEAASTSAFAQEAASTVDNETVAVPSDAIEKLTEDFPLATPVEAVQAPAAPLDLKGKTDYYLKATFSPEAIGRIAFTSGFKQLRGSDTYGSGIGGLGHSVGARYAEHITKRTIQFGIGAARGEDPRFYRSNKSGTWSRVAFQLKRTVTVQMDNGGTSLAVGKLAGTFGANAISAYWDPRRPDPVKSGLSNTGVNLAGDLATRIIREFWPDMKRLFRR